MIAAADGEEALRLLDLHDHEIDLLVADLMMPRMGGVELARRITTLDPNLQIILISGYSSETLAVTALAEIHTLTFLDEPVTVDKLLTAVTRTLTQARPQRTPL